MRDEFTKATKSAAWERCGGFCECGCAQRIVGTPEYHHNVHAAIGGSNSLDNCVVLSSKCHKLRTAKLDIPQIAKTKRIAAKRAGIKADRPKSRPLPGTKASGIRKRMDGRVERR